MDSLSCVGDLTCAICLSFFCEPLSLPCGHSFCRECVTKCLAQENLCPQCRTTIPTDAIHFSTNHILKSLAEKARATGDDKTVAYLLCPEHEEKMKLFCVTDQQLACVICRDGEKHDGHRFKPIKEAAISLRQELEKNTECLCVDIRSMELLAKSQKDEKTKMQETYHQLMSCIDKEFEEMYQFLKKRENEIKQEVQQKEIEAAGLMDENLKAIEFALSESKEVEAKVKSALDITDSERFLQSWTQGSTVSMDHEALFRSRANVLNLTPGSLSLGRYESHLQFSVWKDMLKVVTSIPETFSLETSSGNMIESVSGVILGPNKPIAKTMGFSFGAIPTTASAPQPSLFGQSSSFAPQPFLSARKPTTNQTFGFGSAFGST